MSVSLRYQGLPPGSGLIELVQKGAWGSLGIFSAYHWLVYGARVQGQVIKPAPGTPFPYPNDDDEPVWNWCCDAVGRFPNLPKRNIDVHKSYRWLPFVLSAKVRKRRRWPKPDPLDPRAWDDPETGFDQLVDLAFQGAPQIAPGVTGSQGIPIRLMERSIVSDFGLCVGALEQREVDRWIVEFVASRQDPTWHAEQCAEIFAQFQTFFVQAAEQGEDVLVIWE